MQAQAVGEALSESGSEDDGDFSGLAAAMGKMRGSSAHSSRPGASVTDDDEAEGEEASEEERGDEEEQVRVQSSLQVLNLAAQNWARACK
jgi:hypothetical protein